MPDKPECTCPNCASVLFREDVLESHRKLLTAFFTDINAMGLNYQDTVTLAASLAADMANNIYANAIEGEDDTPETQDAYTQSFIGIVEDLLEQRITMGEDDEEHPAAAEQTCEAEAEPVYVGTFGGDPDTRH